MSAGRYAFIDITVLDEIRESFAAGEPLMLLTPDLERVLWANGPGACFLGYRNVQSCMNAPARLSPVLRRQIIATPGFPDLGRDRTVALRLATGGFSTETRQCRLSTVRLPDRRYGVLLAVPAWAPSGRSAECAIAGIGSDGQFAALVDGKGAVLACSDGFERLSLAPTALQALIDEVREEADRLVKRMVAVPGSEVAAGIARLCDDPPLHFLVLVGEISAAAEPDPEDAEPESAGQPGAREQEPAGQAEPEGKTEESTAPVQAEEETPPVQTSLPLSPPNAAEPAEGREHPKEPAEESGTAPSAEPLRFNWRTDAEGRILSVSGGFGELFGPEAGRLAGHTFAEAAERFGIDRDGEIAALLAGRETWSGRTVLWPIEGSDRMVPVDLAALPTYGRDRSFEGFRGFAVARPAEAVADPERRGLTLAKGGRARPADPDPATADEPVPADKVIRLDDRRGVARVLSESERNAFRIIAEKLRSETAREEPGAGPLPVAATPEQPTAPEEDRASTERPAIARAGFLPSAFASLSGNREVLDALPFAVLVRRGDALLYANEAFFDLTGYGDLEALASGGGYAALLAGPAALAGEDGQRAMRLIRRDGSPLAVNAHLRAVEWPDGRALMLVLQQAGTDPAESDAEARIAELTTIIDTATDGIVLIHGDGTVRSINRSAEALFGFESDEIAGKPFTSLFAVESQRSAADYLAGLSDNGVASVLNDGREVIGREAQGRYIPLFMTIGRLPHGGGFCAVMRDITAWKRAEEELIQARGTAERESSHKTGFLARISHEIRTPLNAIIGFSELMMDERFGPIGNERYRGYLRDINRSGNHVLDLVNDLLDISKIEAGEQELKFEAVSLNDALADAVAMMQPAANRERVIIRSSFASRLPHVVADLRTIKQIALNLLSNAIRFTPAGGQVIVSTALEASGDVALRVRDTGIGMSRADIEQALRPFKQVIRLDRKNAGGTGLGLPLTKAMAEANRARFAIDSVPEEGTIVEITFPATRVLIG